MSDLAEQIDALLALNAKGAVSHPVPGLAVELLTKAADALRASPAPLPVTVTYEMAEASYHAGMLGLDRNGHRAALKNQESDRG